MFSMTGYGKGVAAKDGLQVTVELKSVNHRFLDVAFKLPRNLQFAEAVLREEISRRFSRGHIDVFLSVEDSRERSGAVLDVKLAEEYLKIGATLKGMGFENDLGVAALIRIPDIIKSPEPDAGDEELVAAIREAAAAAAATLAEMRLSEGERLKKDISGKVDDMEEMVRGIKARAPEAMREYREKLTERIREALGEVTMDEGRILTEAAIYADRVAVDEEITRLFSHMANYREIISGSTPMGKKLDFLTQEVNREANTIGSKCNDITITKIVLELKNVIETVREQVQNIE